MPSHERCVFLKRLINEKQTKELREQKAEQGACSLAATCVPVRLKSFQLSHRLHENANHVCFDLGCSTVAVRSLLTPFRPAALTIFSKHFTRTINNLMLDSSLSSGWARHEGEKENNFSWRFSRFCRKRKLEKSRVASRCKFSCQLWL